MGSCSTIDHVYPAPLNGPTKPGTLCYCGRRSWGDHNGYPVIGSPVTIHGEERWVIDDDIWIAGDRYLKIDSPVRGRIHYLPGEIK